MKNKYIKLILIVTVIAIWVTTLLLFSSHPISYWISFWWMFPVAFMVAIIVNTVGISGSALFVPFFILIFPLLAEPLSAGQSIILALITESFGLSSSAIAFISFGLVDKKLGMKTVFAAIPFVILGSIVSFQLSDNMLRIIVAIALFISVLLMLNKKRKESKLECIHHNEIGEYHKHPSMDNISMKDKSGKVYKYCRSCGSNKRLLGYSLGAILQGAAGFGIGELGIISMNLTGIPLRITIGTSHIIVASTAIIASLIHFFSFSQLDIVIPWNILIFTVPAVLIGGQVAPYVSVRLKTNFLEYFITILFSIIAAALLWISF